MNILAFTVLFVLGSTKSVIAIGNRVMFALILADNTPQHSMISESRIKCALACRKRSACHAFHYGSQTNETDLNCLFYDWLTLSDRQTLSEGGIHVFAITPDELVHDLILLQGHLTAELSTTHQSFHGSKAFDGSYDTFMHTLAEVSPWIQLDIHEIAAVRAVEIWNRYSRSPGVELRLRNVLISVAVASDEEGFGERLTKSACSYSQGTQARVKLHLCYEAMDGRHVRITAVEANDILNLFEVEIFV